MNYQSLKNKHLQNITLCIVSALCFSSGWVGFSPFFIFFSIVPLLIIEKRSSTKVFLLYSSISIILWNLLTTFWISKAAVIGIVSAVIDNTVLMIIPLWLYSYTRKRGPKSLAYTILVAGIIASQYLDFNGEISWPWIVLGNVFASSHKIIQWYEYTGVLGGSLWILLTNILLYEVIFATKRVNLYYVLCIIIFIVPIIISTIIYQRYNINTGNVLKVAIIQPNIDPYIEKFNSMSYDRQTEIIDSLISVAPNGTDYIIAPETAINTQIDERTIDNHYSIIGLKYLLDSLNPSADLIAGTNTYIFYNDCNSIRPSTSARDNGDGTFYDISNSAISINPQRNTDIYKKSQLVIGVEMLPYQGFFNKLGDFSIKLGGISGSLQPQEDREVFVHTKNATKSGTAICYESVYGEFFSGFVKNGAQVMFVITNDGWWDDTYGYKQHFDYSRLRAIENRRYIARSANTGISGFFNPKGDVINSLGWDKRGTMVSEIETNDKVTFYTKYGDYIGRLSSYIFLLSLLYFISLKYKNKLNIN